LTEDSAAEVNSSAPRPVAKSKAMESITKAPPTRCPPKSPPKAPPPRELCAEDLEAGNEIQQSPKPKGKVKAAPTSAKAKVKAPPGH
jgi:hypothetical protein